MILLPWVLKCELPHQIENGLKTQRRLSAHLLPKRLFAFRPTPPQIKELLIYSRDFGYDNYHCHHQPKRRGRENETFNYPGFQFRLLEMHTLQAM